MAQILRKLDARRSRASLFAIFNEAENLTSHRLVPLRKRASGRADGDVNCAGPRVSSRHRAHRRRGSVASAPPTPRFGVWDPRENRERFSAQGEFQSKPGPVPLASLPVCGEGRTADFPPVVEKVDWTCTSRHERESSLRECVHVNDDLTRWVSQQTTVSPM